MTPVDAYSDFHERELCPRTWPRIEKQPTSHRYSSGKNLACDLKPPKVRLRKLPSFRIKYVTLVIHNTTAEEAVFVSCARLVSSTSQNVPAARTR